MRLFRRGRFPKKEPSERIFDDDISVASYESGDELTEEPYGTLVQGDISTLSVYEAVGLSSSEFRILTLSPANNKTDDINCTLESVEFETTTGTWPVYEALSYTWGDNIDRCMIYVNRLPFPVTRNLDVALRYLREPDKPRVLWIDAVCINQWNLAEKTHQVGMMRSIYRNASRVLIWLGETDKDIRKAMAFLQRADEVEGSLYTPPSSLAEYREALQQVKEEGKAEKRKAKERKAEERKAEERNANDLSEKLRPFALGLAKIFQKQWWFRVWVVQEMLVAKKPPLLGCGRKWISWKVVRKLMYNVGLRESNGVLSKAEAVFNLALMAPDYSDLEIQRPRPWRSFKYLLVATSDRNTTQPHDKIYALLGLVTDNANEEIDIDYEQPYSMAYQKAMVHVLKSAKDLEFLMFAMNRRISSEIPSWCVDFSIPEWNSQSYLPIPLREWQRGPLGASGRQTKATISHQPDRGTIQIMGTVVGRINQIHVSKCRTPGLTTWDQRTDLNELLRKDNMVNVIGSWVLWDISTFTPMVRTVVENRFGKKEALQMLASGIVWKTALGFDDISKHVGEGFTWWQKYLIFDKYSALEKYVQLTFPDYRTLSRDWSHLGFKFPNLQKLKNWALRSVVGTSRWLTNESLFTTDTGFFGKAPTPLNALEPGDLLCIIYGCGAPIVLRPSGESYKVVTFAHVNELAKGEYFDGPERQIETFTLC
ncbi:MAG: hypothetical protein Q9208_000591 [Pyrenodesmia sp. 3 TL-2023]